MKTTAVLTAAFLMIGGSVMAQTTANPTVSGSQSAPANGAGMPGATAPTGQVTTSTVTGGSPMPAGNVAAGQPMAPSVGSSTTTPNVPAVTK